MKTKKFFLSLVLIFLSAALFAQEWYVCLSSFKNKENADRFCQTLTDNNLPSWVFLSKTDKGNYYRVLFETPCSDINKAHLLRDKITSSKQARKFNLTGLWVCVAQKPAVPKTQEPEPIQETVPEPLPPPEPEPLPEPELLPEPEPLPEPLPPPVEPQKSIILSSNKKEDTVVSEEKPYSVLVNTYKEEPPAIRDKERLEQQNIDAYILKTYDDDDYFTFNLHAGAYETEEESEELLDQLEDMGIEGARVSDYFEIKDSLEKFDEVIDKNVVSYDSGNNEIPDIFSPSIQRIIAEYPINQSFQLDNISIVDVQNVNNSSYTDTKDLDLEDLFPMLIDELPDILAVSNAEYKDSLYNKTFNYLVAEGKNNCFKNMQQKIQQEEAAAYIPLKVKKDIYDAWFITDEYDDTYLYAFSKDRNDLVYLESADFTKQDFEALINDFSNDSSLLIYPQIRKNLLTLPKKTSAAERDFIYFNLKQLDESYAESKNYARWAVPIVGHWKSDTVFVQDGKEILTGFFDLDYDYNARNLHQIFMEEHYEEDIYESNHPCIVNNNEGWFLGSDYLADRNELSFSNKIYIIAITSYSPGLLTEEELISFAQELQIWDAEVPDAK